MNAQPLQTPNFPDNIIEVNFRTPAPRRSTSIYKSDGKPKATAADPIRNLADIKAIQQHFLKKKQHRNYALFTVGILFGLRGGDLLSLRIHHIMHPDGTFKSHCNLYEQKTRKFNNPAITPQIQRVLADYLASLPGYDYDDFLFRSRQRDSAGHYRPLTIEQCNNILRTAARACGLTAHISSHSLRKTFAYQMLRQNPANDEVKFALQRMLNHNDFKTTLAYCGLAQDTLDTYRATLGAAFIDAPSAPPL